jgi:hypothetical protein
MRNPQSFNRYVYAGNSPLAGVDPLGLNVGAPQINCGGQCNNGDVNNPFDSSSNSVWSGAINGTIPTVELNTSVFTPSGQIIPFGMISVNYWTKTVPNPDYNPNDLTSSPILMIQNAGWHDQGDWSNQGDWSIGYMDFDDYTFSASVNVGSNVGGGFAPSNTKPPTPKQQQCIAQAQNTAKTNRTILLVAGGVGLGDASAACLLTIETGPGFLVCEGSVGALELIYEGVSEYGIYSQKQNDIAQCMSN